MTKDEIQALIDSIDFEQKVEVTISTKLGNDLGKPTLKGGNRKVSVTGVKNVYPLPNGKYFSSLLKDGVRLHLGTFNTIDEAHQAYLAAKYNQKEISK